jgi:cyclic beta-1,2-glucan synthetase
MYRLIVESLLGLHLEANTLTFKPCIPAEWTTFKLNYRFRDTTYRITVLQISSGTDAPGMLVDGVSQTDGIIHLNDDRVEHEVEIKIAAIGTN